MFAVMKTGGKQYRVQPGDMLRVEKLDVDAGETVEFNEILMVGSTVGAPLVDGAAVRAEVVDQIKDKKVINFVKRRRKHSSKRTKGHRQKLTLLRITDILDNGSSIATIAAAVAAPAAAIETITADDVAPVKPGNLLAEAREGGADDLKRISGVGPKLETLLHENGVFHFDQIMAWGPAEIAYMDDQLSFKGRIERDNWIAQATEFAAEKE